VAGPEWIAVDVAARVAVTSAEDADPVRDRVSAALARFLHPLSGGPRGDGWAFGRWPRASVLSALVEAVGGVDHVASLAVSYQPDTADEDRKGKLREILERRLTDRPTPPEQEPDLWHWLDRALVSSGRHDISVAIAPAGNQTVRTADADPAA
jgi:AcrR family transcriptional regulator